MIANSSDRAGSNHDSQQAQPGCLAGSPIVLSPNMCALYELVERAARPALPVLVCGETGAGKGLVARAVHDHSPRARGPFKALNCATTSPDLIESALFGHERGSLAGADGQAQGIFEQARGGSVFLDEIGALSSQAQAALLRALELRRIVRVGGTREIEIDARVIAATHHALHAMAAAGAFREDLLFRLDAVSLRVPPLRERREEIVPLAELFLRAAREHWGASPYCFSRAALCALRAYAWPGNVRQLKNVVERAAVMCAAEVIELADLPPQVRKGSSQEASEAEGVPRLSLPELVRIYEIGLIREALRGARGSQAEAARRLGVPRRTLAHKVLSYGLRQGPAPAARLAPQQPRYDPHAAAAETRPLLAREPLAPKK